MTTPYYDEDPVREHQVLTMARNRAEKKAEDGWDRMTGPERNRACWEARDVLDAVAEAGLAVLDLNRDRRMFPERTAETADAWAECARVLVYSAGGNTGLRYPGDVYRMLGSTKTGAARLVELSERSSEFLRRQHAAGNLKLDRQGPEGDVTDYVEAARTALADAATAAQQLADAWSRAQNALSRVAGNTD